MEASCPAGLPIRDVGGVTADLVQQNRSWYGATATPFRKAGDKGLPDFCCIFLLKRFLRHPNCGAMAWGSDRRWPVKVCTRTQGAVIVQKLERQKVVSPNFGTKVTVQCVWCWFGGCWGLPHLWLPQLTLSIVQVFGFHIALHQGTFLLKLLHGWLLIALTLRQEKTTAQHIHCGIMNLFPAMETSTLTQCADSVGEGVVQVMEEHLIETMFATQQEGHDPAEHWITAGGVLGQELVPPMGMVEVGEECPGDGEASSASDGHR